MSLTEGQQLPEVNRRVTRADLVAYANASGDQNPIHQSEEVARSVGLPGVIAHGMYTLAIVAAVVEEWAGSREAVLELNAKFTKPVVVPAGDEGATVLVQGHVKTVADDRVTIAMTVTCGDDKVLGNPVAVLRA